MGQGLTMEMTRRERLSATLKGHKVDRPPVNLYEVGGFIVDPADSDEFNIYNSPDWRILLKLANEQTDLIRMVSPVRQQSHSAWDTSSKKTSAKDEFFKTKNYMENGNRITRITVKVGGRELTSILRRTPEIDTVWTVEHLLKSVADLNSYLKLPDSVFEEELDFNPLFEEEKKLGDRGVVMVDTEDPLCAAATLFRTQNFTVAAYSEKNLFHRLLEKCARYIHARTERVAKEFPGRLWRIYGSEFAAEPYLPPKLFREYSVRYTAPMVETIKKHGGFVRIHCHGRIRNIVDDIVEMGADAIDPIEPAPNGDVELKYVRRKYGEQLVLFGNLEIVDLERLPTEQFAEKVKTALQHGTEGKGRGFVLMTSASPIGRELSPLTLKNYETMITMCREYNES